MNQKLSVKKWENPNNLKLFTKMEFQKFISQGNKIKIASKKNNKSYKKQSAKKEV